MTMTLTANLSQPTQGKREMRLSRSLSGTNLARAGDYNLRTVLQAVRLSPGTTRLDIARKTGLTSPTIANITSRLIDLGLVRVTGRRQGGRGQPALQLEVEPDGAFGIGVNVDRDHLTLLVLDLAGVVRSRITQDIGFPMPHDVVQFVCDNIDAVFASGSIDPTRVLGVGVAIPDELGSIGFPNRPHGYEAWTATDLPGLLTEVLAWPIHCDNDAAAAALGEAEYGTAYDNPSFFYLLLNAGLGGGLVIDRRFHRGATSRSGEIGLMPDPTRGDGALVQDTVSLSALSARFTAAGTEMGRACDLDDANPAARTIIERWLTDAVASLVQPVVAINCLLNPDAILIGGRLPGALVSELAERLTRTLANLSLPSRAQIMAAVIAQDAPAVGAATLPFLDRLLPSDAILVQAGR